MKKWIELFDRRFGLRNRFHGLPQSGFDLTGEKVLDWGWCLANIPRTPSLNMLDVGCCQAPIVPTAHALGHKITGIDTAELPYQMEGLTFYQGDFLDVDLSDALFDVVVLCSVVEHIGLQGRYDQKEIPDGDLFAMAKVARILKPGGQLLLTVPIGKDIVFRPYHRIYGEKRLPLLIDKFQIERSQYFVKQLGEPWKYSQRAEALSVDRQGLSYGLGQFVLEVGKS